MVRTQVILTEDQHRFLKELSQETGDSLSSLVRQAVEGLRQRQERTTERAIDLLGAFEADRDDVSERHDEHFAAGAE